MKKYTIISIFLISPNRRANVSRALLLLLLVVALTTCKKEPDAPTGGNKIEIGQTTTDSLAYYTATVSTNISSTGGNTITQHGHCWSTKSKPTTDDAKTTFGKLDAPKTYTSQLAGLTPNTTYYIRSYVSCPQGTVYGTEKSIQTLEPGKPVVTTNEVTNITNTSATTGGDVISDGNGTVTARGVCWNTTGNPTLQNNTGHTTDDSGTGSFISNLSGLTENTTYYMAAYATNEKGTAYGEIKTFETLELTLPVVETATPTNITGTSAMSGGNVTNDGNGTVTARGVCWNTTGNPTLQNNTGHTTDGSGTGTFTSNISGLSENTTYFAAAYATNEKGTAYGQVKVFVAEESFFEFISVTGGTFQMGSNGGSDEQPIHTVTLSSFEITKYEITNSQYCEFLNDIGCNSNGSFNDPEFGNVEYIDMDDVDCQINHSGGQFVPESGKDDFPVIEVSWYGAHAFSQWAGGRLPTEAEWEFAARGGNSSNGYTYSGSNTLGDVGWYGDNSGGSTNEVGTKAPNELGIYDMSGNVWEWCHDWYNSSYYSSSPQNNPQGPASGSYRVLRGGSWDVIANNCRVANRRRDYPVGAYLSNGFRVVR